MLRFKEYITEAYNFIPKSVEDIEKSLAKFPAENVEEIIKLFNYLLPQDSEGTPINIDLKRNNKINVRRFPFKQTTTEADITQHLGLKAIKIKFGNGSMGGRGSNNKGNAFERIFADACDSYIAGENDSKYPTGETLKVIEGLVSKYNFDKSTWYPNVVGGKNTKRPLEFGGMITIKNIGGTGFDIGKAVTDVTIHRSGDFPVFLSLKTSSTTTFFNVGVKTKLTKKEIDEGEVKNIDGKKLLDLFGIDNKRFCTIFNDNVKTKSGKVTVPASKAVETLLASGIGHGYHVIHAKGGKIDSYEIDKKYMQDSSKVGTMTLHYGGKRGEGKRIDMEMESSHYKFKLNIRDTQGKDGYPTRMMCDFTKK